MASNDDDTSIDRRTLLGLGIGSISGLTLGVGTVSANDSPQTFSIPLGGCRQGPPCIGEELCLTGGVLQLRIHTFTTDSGSVHFTRHSHFDPIATAVGQSSGTEWTGQGTINGSRQLKGPFPQTIQINDNTVLTSTGSTEDIHLHTNTHLTINANGQVTVDRTDIDYGCKG